MSFDSILEGVDTSVALDFEDVDIRVIGSSGGDYNIEVVDCTVIFESLLSNYDDALVLSLVPKRIKIKELHIETMADDSVTLFSGSIGEDLKSISDLHINGNVENMPLTLVPHNIVVKIEFPTDGEHRVMVPKIKMVDIDLDIA
jgi:hypothetical protein